MRRSVTRYRRGRHEKCDPIWDEQQLLMTNIRLAGYEGKRNFFAPVVDCDSHQWTQPAYTPSRWMVVCNSDIGRLSGFLMRLGSF